LINVLRDTGSDLRAGRCYFPEHELSDVHVFPSQILSDPERFLPVYRIWLEKAKAGLMSGMEYSRAIQNRRVRAATALPALIGARTLALLKASGADAGGFTSGTEPSGWIVVTASAAAEIPFVVGSG